MSKTPTYSGLQSDPASARKAERKERLAAQLRANLKRRKATIRARDDDNSACTPAKSGRGPTSK